MTKIKICGIMSLGDARAAVIHGADMLGFHFSKRSPYRVDHDEATTICDTLRQSMGEACPLLIGVFVDELVSNVSAITLKVGLDGAQLSGHESDAMLKELRGIGYKSIDPMNEAMALDDVKYYGPHFPANEKLPSLALDVFFEGFKGDAAARTAVALAVKEQVPRLMLTGGFRLENASERVQAINPWAVDINESTDKGDAASGKDQAKIKAIIDAVRSA